MTGRIPKRKFNYENTVNYPQLLFKYIGNMSILWKQLFINLYNLWLLGLYEKYA